jgi:hypothetical protein
MGIMRLLGARSESRTARRGKYSRARLFVEKARLVCDGSSGGWFATGDADDTQNGKFGEGGAGDKNAVGGGVEVGRSDLDAVVEHREQIIGNDALDGFAVAVTQADPQSIEFRAAEEGFAFGLKVVGEIANEINGAHLLEGNFLMLAVGSEEVDGVGLPESRGIEIAAEGLLVGEDKDDLLVSRGWGSVFQRNQFAKVWESRNLRIIKMYVMLSAFCLSTYCFH